MTRANLTNLGRLANRRLQLRLTPANPVACCRVATSIQIPLQIPHHLRNPSYRPVTSSFFSTSSHLARPLSPDVLSRVKAAEITDEQYHELSDEYLENLLNKFENAQDERDDMDVEYSVRFLPSSLAFPSFPLIPPSYFAHSLTHLLFCPFPSFSPSSPAS